jgi:hypothetical protein
MPKVENKYSRIPYLRSRVSNAAQMGWTFASQRIRESQLTSSQQALHLNKPTGFVRPVFEDKRKCVHSLSARSFKVLHMRQCSKEAEKRYTYSQYYVSRDTERCNCDCLRIEGRSDKAETYSDRFDMVIKIEECLFVSRCHQEIESQLAKKKTLCTFRKPFKFAV